MALTPRYPKSVIAIVLLTFTMGEPNTTSAQWQHVNGVPSNYVNAVRVDGTTGLWFAAGYSYGVVRSSDRGASWSSATTGLTQFGMYVYDLIFFEGFLFAGTRDGVFRSTTSGDTWEQVNTGIARPLSDQYISAYAFGVLNGTLHAGTRGGAYATTNNGISWSPVIVNGNNVYQVDAFLQIGDTMFAGGGDRFLSGHGLFRSTNGGTGWTLGQVHSFPLAVFCLANTHTGLYVGTSHGAFRSTNTGASWTRVSEGLGADPYVFSILSHGDSLIAGTFGGVYLSIDSGNHWTSMSDNLPSTARGIQCMVNIDDTLYVGTETGGLWRRPFSSPTTEVSEDGFAPNGFVLQQNYPNPFNPTTRITFTLSSQERDGLPASENALRQAGVRSHVTLKIFDVLGREVATLVNEEMGPGTYSVTLEARALAGGTYMYRLTSGNETQVKKMVLMK